MQLQGKVWGETARLFNKNNVEVHDLKINKGGYCSRHSHKHKYNLFIVRKGKLKVTIWKQYANNEVLEDITVLSDNQELAVAPGDDHMFEALENTEALEIYWVELSENDIARKNHGGVKSSSHTTSAKSMEKVLSENPGIFGDLL